MNEPHTDVQILDELDSLANIYGWHHDNCNGHAHNPSCPVVKLRRMIADRTLPHTTSSDWEKRFDEQFTKRGTIWNKGQIELTLEPIIDFIRTEIANERARIAEIEKQYSEDFLRWRQSGLMKYTEEQVANARREERERIAHIQSHLFDVHHCNCDITPEATHKTEMCKPVKYSDIPKERLEFGRAFMEKFTTPYGEDALWKADAYDYRIISWCYDYFNGIKTEDTINQTDS